MAETGFSSRPVPVVPSRVETREVFEERPRENDQRIQPVSDTEDTETSRDDAQARSEEIERLARQALANSRLKIQKDESSGQFVYLMIDEETGEEVRRWPSEKQSELLNFLQTQRAGIVDERA